jgi:hypothetical protein
MKFHPHEILAVFGSGTVAAWIYCGLAVCLITGSTIVVRHRYKTQRRRIHARVSAPIIKNKTRLNDASPNPPSATAKNSPLNGHIWPKPVFRRKRRKRMFNYSKFCASVMRELSLHTYHPANMTNGKSHANGHSNGASNGRANGHPGDHTAPNGTMANQTIKPEIVDLIASQQNLIEEQKSLLEQQARLIEEKSRLIEEQTAFLITKRAA